MIYVYVAAAALAALLFANGHPIVAVIILCSLIADVAAQLLKQGAERETT